VADNPADWSRPRVAAGVLFFDDAGQIMLVKPTYKDGWDIPGGYVNSGETPYEAGIREVREELGLDVVLGGLLVADWAPHPNEGDKILFVFNGGELGHEQRFAIALQSDELAEYRFFHPADAYALLVPRLARRLQAAIRARAAGEECRYLEHGARPTEPSDVHELAAERQWAILRQDDNGNCFTVSLHATREDAEVAMSIFQNEGHKQIYWVERGDYG
jgi:8-oxo-dGTP pyrophosphatase MutT (NUDIX family)